MKLFVSIRLFSLVLMVLLVAPLAFAGDSEIQAQIQTAGDDSAVAGSVSQTEITVLNTGSLPILDGKLVIELVKPDSANENVLSEISSENFNLMPGQSQTEKLALPIPNYAATGDYRLDIYLKAGRTSVVGSPVSFSSPNSRLLKIKNYGSYMDVRINRTSTVVCGILEGTDSCFARQLGPTVEPNSKVQARLGLVNLQNYSIPAKLKWSVYEWDDTLNQSPVSVSESDVQLTPGNSIVPIEFIAPAKPTAYAIRISAYSGDNLLSIYRSRIVVKGASSRIKKLVSDSNSYRAGSDVNLHATLVGSADGQTPISGTITTELTDNARNSIVFSNETQFSFGSVTIEATGFAANSNVENLNYPFKTQHSMNDFTLSAVIKSSGNIIDSYSVRIKNSAFRPEIGKAIILVSGNENLDSLSDSYEDWAPFFVWAKYFDTDGNEIKDVSGTIFLSNNNVSAGPESLDRIKSFSLGKGEYDLTLNYPDGKAVKTVRIGLPPVQKSAVIEEPKTGSISNLIKIVAVIIGIITALLAIILISRRKSNRQ